MNRPEDENLLISGLIGSSPAMLEVYRLTRKVGCLVMPRGLSPVRLRIARDDLKRLMAVRFFWMRSTVSVISCR